MSRKFKLSIVAVMVLVGMAFGYTGVFASNGLNFNSTNQVSSEVKADKTLSVNDLVVKLENVKVSNERDSCKTITGQATAYNPATGGKWFTHFLEIRWCFKNNRITSKSPTSWGKAYVTGIDPLERTLQPGEIENKRGVDYYQVFSYQKFGVCVIPGCPGTTLYVKIQVNGKGQVTLQKGGRL